MKKKYGVLLIGCGHIGEAHISEIYYRDDIRIVGVCDYNEDAARLFARKYGAEHFATSYKELLVLPEVDIVIIATYARSHLAILKDCLAAGKHVLCEKPMTEADFDSAKEFYRTVKAAKTKILIAHILRHNKTYERARELIRNGVIGDVRLVRMVQNHHIMNKGRYATLLHDCPPVVDCGVHYVDVLRWFTGLEIDSVYCMGTNVDGREGVEFDHGLLCMKLSNGGSAYYEAGWCDNLASQNTKEFIGTKGRIRIVLSDFRPDDHEEGDKIEYYSSETKEYKTINSPSRYKDMYAQIETLIDMIENDTEGNPSFDEAYEAFMISLMGEESARRNEVLPVDHNWKDTVE